ncbi:MAG: methyltransferase domain-containing protein, partial [Cyanobacteria bacterium P01_C01_bin.72]
LFMNYRQVNSKLNHLNLGCRYRFNSQWTNVNFIATGENVIPDDLNKGIPFADNTFELVYHSHVLEHFSRLAAKSFIQECYRVLRPGGILRVVVPDFEQIARLYTTSLEKAPESAEWTAKYEWIALEILDQMVRNSRGGEMANYFAQAEICNQDFVLQRFGAEAQKLKPMAQQKTRFKDWARQIKGLEAKVYQLLPKTLNRFYIALKIGYYRQSGEVHQWMYDSYSLSQLLANCDLQDIVKRTASDSYLDRWSNFNLDTEPDGKTYKPDSLYMEAIKPVAGSD